MVPFQVRFVQFWRGNSIFFVLQLIFLGRCNLLIFNTQLSWRSIEKQFYRILSLPEGSIVAAFEGKNDVHIENRGSDSDIL